VNRGTATRRPLSSSRSQALAEIERLEPRAMLAGLGQDSLSGLGSTTAVLLPGVSSAPEIVLTGGSHTLGSKTGTVGSQPPSPVLLSGTGPGTGSSTAGTSSNFAAFGPILFSGTGSAKGSSPPGTRSSSSDPNGPVFPLQYTGGSNAGTQGTGTNTGSSVGGSDLWLLYGAGLGAGSSSSGASGGSSSNLLTLLSQYQEGSSASGQGNGSGNTLSNADLWGMYWSGAGAGSSSGSDNGSLADDPTISAQYTGGSGIGGITPLVYNPESDGPPVFHSGVWTGDDGSLQFVQTADAGNQGTGAGDALQSEGEPKPRTLWQWFWGDDPIKGSLWKLGPSRISRAGDRPTHNDDKSAVESLEDGGKLAKELIEGAERDAALAALGAVVGKLGAQNGVPKASTVNGIKAPGLFNDTVGSLDEARAAIKKAFPDAVELPPALPGKPYPSPPPGVKKWFQVHPPEPGVGNDLPHIKYVDWTTGKKGTGGSWGHLFFLD